MARRATDREPEAMPHPTDGTSAPVRRAPYSDNPEVGTRGLRTQQRILDAALQVFGESGYERSTLDRIGQLAGCSRVSIYQYFSGKDDVFRHLAGQVARQMRASAEALAPLTADADGWAALRAWVVRYSDIHARYEAVFRAFGAASQSDAGLAGGSARAGERNIAVFQSKLATTTLPPRQLEPVVSLLMASVDAHPRHRHDPPRRRSRTSTPRTGWPTPSPMSCTGRSSACAPTSTPGRRAVTSRRAPDRRRRSTDGCSSEPGELELEATQPGRRALASLLEVGQDVIVGRGYHGTRVDDVVAAAGVSHGAFYRYFENKDELVQVIAVRSLRAVSGALAEVPSPGDRTALRRWLRHYNAVHAAEGAMIRVWVEAVDDPMRRRPRRDVRLGAAAAGPRPARSRVRRRRHRWRRAPRRARGLRLARAQPVEVDAALHVVEHGFLGLE